MVARVQPDWREVRLLLGDKWGTEEGLWVRWRHRQRRGPGTECWPCRLLSALGWEMVEVVADMGTAHTHRVNTEHTEVSTFTS